MILTTKMPVKGEIGWIEFIVGTMFAGKTEELLRNLRRVEHAKIPFIVIKHREMHGTEMHGTGACKCANDTI